jgi:hypothetical protein
MRNIVVVTPRDVTQTMVQALVEALGGYWNADAALDQGVVERGDAVVYVSGSQELDPDYEAHDITLLTQLLGHAPRAVIDIHVGHGPGSAALAEAVAREVIERWGGFLDDNTQDLAEVLLQRTAKQPKPSV